ncbi:MAG: hypothetical protein ACFFD4_32100 [Candidatus Odinarchaeota archaeon]
MFIELTVVINLFVRMVTVPVISRTFDELTLIREEINRKVLPVMIRQDGWIKADIIYSKVTRKFRIISYWHSKEEADVFEEEKPELSSLQYMQFGQFAEYFDTENLEIEYFEHLESLEKPE